MKLILYEVANNNISSVSCSTILAADFVGQLNQAHKSCFIKSIMYHLFLDLNDNSTTWLLVLW